MPLLKKAAELLAHSRLVREDSALALAHAVKARLRAQRLALKRKRKVIEKVSGKKSK